MAMTNWVLKMQTSKTKFNVVLFQTQTLGVAVLTGNTQFLWKMWRQALTLHTASGHRAMHVYNKKSNGWLTSCWVYWLSTRKMSIQTKLSIFRCTFSIILLHVYSLTMKTTQNLLPDTQKSALMMSQSSEMVVINRTFTTEWILAKVRWRLWFYILNLTTSFPKS